MGENRFAAATQADVTRVVAVVGIDTNAQLAGVEERTGAIARNAIAAAFACLVNVKHVFVVDPDIDLFSDAQIESLILHIRNLR